MDRLELQAFLESLLGSRNVYHKKPSDDVMKYPCIVYTLDDEYKRHANNSVFLKNTAYLITYIDADPDSDMPDKITRLPLCRFVRPYTSDNLNHWVYRLFV